MKSDLRFIDLPKYSNFTRLTLLSTPPLILLIYNRFCAFFDEMLLNINCYKTIFTWHDRRLSRSNQLYFHSSQIICLASRLEEALGRSCSRSSIPCRMVRWSCPSLCLPACTWPGKEAWWGRGRGAGRGFYSTYSMPGSKGQTIIPQANDVD